MILLILSLMSISGWGAELSGRVVSLSGKVLIRNEQEKASQARGLKVGDSVHEGEVINTSSNGSAKLLLTDHSIIDVGASTLFKLEEYRLKHTGDRAVTLGMDYGTVRAAVNQPVGAQGRYRFKTKTATMGVRGTEFVVQSDFVPPRKEGTPGTTRAPEFAKTQITVMEGKVEVASGPASNVKPVTLTPGMQVSVAPPAASGSTAGSTDTTKPGTTKTEVLDVKQLSKQELQTVTQGAKISDKTFMQAVVVDNNTGFTKSSGAPAESMSSPNSQPGRQTSQPPKPADNPIIGAVADSVTKNIQDNPNMQVDPKSIGQPQTIYSQLLPPVPIGQPVNLRVSFTP